MVFTITLIAWVVTVLSVSYVGVYLSYITVLLLLLSALVIFDGSAES
jgi:hypothetical protein